MMNFETKDFDISLMHLIKILKRLWFVIVLGVVAGTVIALLLTWLLPPRYEAK